MCGGIERKRFSVWEDLPRSEPDGHQKSLGVDQDNGVGLFIGGFKRRYRAAVAMYLAVHTYSMLGIAGRSRVDQ